MKVNQTFLQGCEDHLTVTPKRWLTFRNHGPNKCHLLHLNVLNDEDVGIEMKHSDDNGNTPFFQVMVVPEAPFSSTCTKDPED